MNAIPLRSNKTVCPHCGAACRTIKTVQLTPTCREITYLCSNAVCGHIFVAQLVPIRTLVPSAMPDPDIRIPERSSP